MHGLAGSQEVIKLFYGRKKPLDFGVPGQRRGIVPGLLTFGDGKRPVKQIAHVRKDLRGCARLVPDVKAVEMGRSAAQCFAAAVRHGSQGMAKKLTGRFG